MKQRHPERIHNAIISMSIGTIILNLKYREMQRGAMPGGKEYVSCEESVGRRKFD